MVQDDRIWLQYGGNWAAAGAGGDCGDDYVGKAYVNDQPWDISALAACQPGSTCRVSDTFTDEHFAVPMGCDAVDVQVQQNAGRGQVTVQQQPSSSNGWRGELAMSDQYLGRTVFDFTATLTCVGSRRTRPVRLSCMPSVGDTTSEAAGASRADRCHMGRIEAWNPRVTRPGTPAPGAWGTVCAAMGRKIILLLTAPVH